MRTVRIEGYVFSDYQKEADESLSIGFVTKVAPAFTYLKATLEIQLPERRRELTEHMIREAIKDNLRTVGSSSPRFIDEIVERLFADSRLFADKTE